MNMQQNANPTADATADAQLAAGGDDVADNITGCRALINSFLCGSISEADLRSQWATSFLPIPSEQRLDLLNSIFTDTRVPFEVFQCVVETTCTPIPPAATSACLAELCRNGNLRLAKWIIKMFPASLLELQTGTGGESFPLLFSILFDELIDDGVVLNVLKLFRESHSEIVRNAKTSKGNSLLHWAASTTTITMRARATDICRSIIHAFPQLVFKHNNDGFLPVHLACTRNLEVVKCMLEKFPDAINAMTRCGFSPLHAATVALPTTPQTALNGIRCLLEVDPGVAGVRSSKGKYPLAFACYAASTYESTSMIGYTAMKAIYNAYPQALANDKELFRALIASDDCKYAVRDFLTKQLRYVEQASDVDFLRTPDENGRIPLQNALREIAPFGSIKLLADANPSALQHRDSSGSLPVHTACEYDDRPDIIMYLLNFDSRSLFDQGNEGNTPLHFACLYENYELIIMLFAKYQNLPVKRRNSDDDLPIHLLVDNRDDSTGYLSCLFLLLKADPDLLLSVDEI